MNHSLLQAAVVVSAMALLAGCSSDNSDESAAAFTTVAASPSPSESMTSDESPHPDLPSEAPATEAQDSAEKKPEPAGDSDEVPREVREKIWNADVPSVGFSDAGKFSEGVMRNDVGAMAHLVGTELGDVSTLTVDNFEVHQGDINNDGSLEYLAAVVSSGGGSGWSKTYVVYDAEAVPQGVMGIPQDMKILRGGPTITSIEGDKISFEWTGFADDDPLCCGSLKGSGTYTWDGERLHAVDGPYFS